MKVMWLNEEGTEAQITVWWFRQRTAYVYRGVEYSGQWYHKATNRKLSFWANEGVEGRYLSKQEARKRVEDMVARAKEWTPYVPLPRAEVVK